MTAGSDGNDERMLVTRAMPRFVGGRGVAWSPHGDLIAFDTGEGIGNQDGGIGLIKADGGEILPITTTPWDFVGNLQWMSDQSGLVFAAKIKSAKPTRIWRIGYPDGSVTPITDEISSYDPSSLSLTANGRSV